ncbi:MAG TPA: thioesterase family protein [Thermoanaerobaculia bacterium]|jgi:acyl-CoA thioester hydrolase|nr:thioesterase family protein [Thermoanaerobaculia bacterium]
MKEKPQIFDRTVEHSVRVRYSETDRMGIVYHANYIVWFEIGRTEFCRAAGFPYRDMEEQGVLILVTGVDCRFRRAARYDDRVTIRTRMGESGSRGLSFFYEVVVADDGMLLAEGSTRHVFVNASNRPITIPPSIREAFARFVGAPAAS